MLYVFCRVCGIDVRPIEGASKFISQKQLRIEDLSMEICSTQCDQEVGAKRSLLDPFSIEALVGLNLSK